MPIYTRRFIGVIRRTNDGLLPEHFRFVNARRHGYRADENQSFLPVGAKIPFRNPNHQVRRFTSVVLTEVDVSAETSESDVREEASVTSS
jgi:hypothetical protein